MRTFSKKQKIVLPDKEIHRILKRIGFVKSNLYIIIKEVHYIINDPNQLKFDENVPIEVELKKLISSNETGKFYILNNLEENKV